MENTDETDTGAPIMANSHAERAALIATALRGLSEITVREKLPHNARVSIDHGLTLAYCGLMALSQIAQAQTDMAALAQRDLASEVEAAANVKAELLTEERIKASSDRSFIGSKG